MSYREPNQPEIGEMNSRSEEAGPPNSNIGKCRIIHFPKVSDHRGNLTFIEERKHVPFDVRRVFYVYDIPSGEDRGAHAHKTLEQVLICLSGALDVHLDDGRERETVHLNRPWFGL